MKASFCSALSRNDSAEGSNGMSPHRKDRYGQPRKDRFGQLRSQHSMPVPISVRAREAIRDRPGLSRLIHGDARLRRSGLRPQLRLRLKPRQLGRQRRGDPRPRHRKHPEHRDPFSAGLRRHPHGGRRRAEDPAAERGHVARLRAHVRRQQQLRLPPRSLTRWRRRDPLADRQPGKKLRPVLRHLH